MPRLSEMEPRNLHVVEGTSEVPQDAGKDVERKSAKVALSLPLAQFLHPTRNGKNPHCGVEAQHPAKRYGLIQF